LLSDLEILEKAINKYSKAAKSGDASLKEKVSLFTELFEKASNGIMLRALITPQHEEICKEYSFLTAKPVMYIMNVDEEGMSSDNEYVKKVREYAEKRKCCCYKDFC